MESAGQRHKIFKKEYYGLLIHFLVAVAPEIDWAYL